MWEVLSASICCCNLRLVCLLSFPIVSWGQANQPHSAQPRITQTPRIIQAIDESVVTRLKGNNHPLARPQFDRGAAPANLPMDRMLLVLRPEQESALTKLLDEQQDRSSPNYHKWLTPEEFGHQFGPADEDIQAGDVDTAGLTCSRW